jgi:hypothetical protein
MPESRIPSEMLISGRCEHRGQVLPYALATADDPDIERPFTSWLQLYSRTSIPAPHVGASASEVRMREESSIRHLLLQLLTRLGNTR